MPAASTPDPRPAPRCAHCGGAATPAFLPFCGQGCRDRDLLRWLSDGHRLPGPPATSADGLDSGAAPRL